MNVYDIPMTLTGYTKTNKHCVSVMYVKERYICIQIYEWHDVCVMVSLMLTSTVNCETTCRTVGLQLYCSHNGHLGLKFNIVQYCTVAEH